MPSILIERRLGSLNYIKESVDGNANPTRLGRLEGIAADFVHPTRNGRRYPRELWVNVMNSDDFKEGMETHTILGENDHPETRVDTSIKEVSIVLTDLNIDDSEGILNAGFDILPTDEGYKLKALLDYGCQIGVSSRGLGDEIQKNGETIIDPDTYVFYAFDAVVMPAVKSARPAVVESVDRQRMIDKFSKDIENATTVAELQSLKEVAAVTKLPDLDSLVESIDIKLNSLNDDNIVSKLEEDLGAISNKSQVLESQLAEATSQLTEVKSQYKSLREKYNANNIRLTEMKKVLDTTRSNFSSVSRELEQYRDIVADLKKESNGYKANLSAMREQLSIETEKFNKVAKNLTVIDEKYTKLESENRNILDRYKSEATDHRSTIDQLSDDNDTLKERLDRLSADNESLDDEKNGYLEEIDKLSSENSILKEKLDKLSDDNNSLRNQLTESKNKIANLSNAKKLTESSKRDISSKLQESNKEMSALTKKYIQTRCAQEGLNYENIMKRIAPKDTIQDIDKLISEASDQNRRLAKVPIVLQPRSVTLTESSADKLNGISEADKQTIEFLRSFK